MTPVTLDGLAHHALTIPPNLSGVVTVRARVETDVEAGLTGRENRRRMGSTLRYELEFDALMSPGVAADLRNALRTLGDGKVRVPFWPALDAGSGDWTARWWMRHEIGDEPGETTAINWGAAGTVPTITGDQHRAPTLLGHLTDAPRFALTGEHVTTSFRFRESSPVTEELTPAARAWTAGASGRSAWSCSHWASSAKVGRAEAPRRYSALTCPTMRRSATCPRCRFIAAASPRAAAAKASR
jgi:hypothetical protein